MVRGWESRVDLANKRKEEARQRKEAKKVPVQTTGEAAMNALLAADAPFPTSEFVVWLASDDGPDKLTCLAHFRGESCGKKRCKHSHGVSIPNLIPVDEEVEAKYMYCVSDIAALARASYGDVYTVMQGSRCVFDVHRACCWDSFSDVCKERRRALIAPADGLPISSGGLAVIKEEPSAADELADDVASIAITGKTDTKMSAVKVEVRREHSFTALPVWRRVMYFCDGEDLCWLAATSKTTRSIIALDEYLSALKSEFLASVSVSGRDISKMRKQDKRKKQKAANARSADKKDGHKKVRVCRR